MYTTPYLKCLPNKGLLCSMELCSILCGILDGRDVWGRMATCICMAETLFCSPEIIAVSYMPNQNKMIFF